MDDKRRFQRVSVPVDVTLSADGHPEIGGGLRDVAVQGIFVTCDSTLQPGTIVWFRITLHGGLEDVEIIGKGEVVRRESEGLGIHFKAIDPESVHHLRNLIALNAEDPEEALEEMRGGHDLRAANHDE